MFIGEFILSEKSQADTQIDGLVILMLICLDLSQSLKTDLLYNIKNLN